MSVDELFSKSNTSMAINKRYPSDKVDQYVADLLRAIELVTEGQVMPPRSTLVAHFKKTLGIEVTPSTVGNHLEALRKDGFIWHR